MTSTTYALSPLTPEDSAALRDQGGELYVADAKPGYPCRQCLRDAEIGEELVLISHDPFDAGSSSPYRSASPIFLHAHDCGAPAIEDGLPAQLTMRQLSVRAFDDQDMMIEAAVIDGADLEGSIDSMFANELAHMIHVHNASRGCYAVRVVRS